MKEELGGGVSRSILGGVGDGVSGDVSLNESDGGVSGLIGSDVGGRVNLNKRLFSGSVSSGIGGLVGFVGSCGIGAGVSDGVGRDVAVGKGGGDGRWLVNDQVLEAEQVVLIQTGHCQPKKE